MRVLHGRLKDYTAEEIIASATVFKTSVWHIKNGQMSIDNLLAPSKFGRWYAQIGKTGLQLPTDDPDDDTHDQHLTQAERLKKIRERMGS